MKLESEGLALSVAGRECRLLTMLVLHKYLLKHLLRAQLHDSADCIQSSTLKLLSSHKPVQAPHRLPGTACSQVTKRVYKN